MNSKFIYLNIDGTHFQSSLDTLSRIPLFGLWIDNVDSDQGYTPDKRLFVDRDWNLFERMFIEIQTNTADKDDLKLMSEKVYYGILEKEHYNYKGSERSESEESEERSEPGDSEEAEDTEEPEEPEEPEIKDEIRELLEFELENLIEHPEPYFVNACGTVFTTTRKRLMVLKYFEIMLEKFKESDESIGTKETPLFIEIVPNAFKSILRYLRNRYFEIPAKYDNIRKEYMIDTSNTPTPYTTHSNSQHRSLGDGYEHTRLMTSTQGTGALMHLVAKDIQDDEMYMCHSRGDRHTTSNTNSIFRQNIQKYSNFSTTKHALMPLNNPDFGKMLTFGIQRCGDLLGRLYLEILINDPSNSWTTNGWKWKKRGMYRLLKRIKLECCNTMVDEITGWVLYQESLLIDNGEVELFEPSPHQLSVRIPIHFFFTRNRQSYLNLMGGNQYILDIELSSLEECIDILDPNTCNLELDQFQLCAEYIYLDTPERNYLVDRNGNNNIVHRIKQHTYMEERIIEDNNDTQRIRLNWYHPTEMIVFTLHTLDDDPFFCGYDGDETKDPLIQASLELNGHRTVIDDAQQLRIVNKLEFGMNIVDIPIYTICFGTNMKDSYLRNDVTSALNFGRIDNATFIIKHRPGVKYIRIWKVSLNLMQYTGPHAGLLRYAN
jgi:hypothetical protein